MRLHQQLAIERMGQRGEGVADGSEGPVFVPYAVPGDRIVAEVDGQSGRLAEIILASPQRIPAFCPAFTQCGGCAIQTWTASAYAGWKRQLAVDALRHGGIEAPVAPLLDAHGAGRRRATFHARTLRSPSGRLSVETGFMRARAHAIIAVEHCPILSPGMAGALRAARGLAEALAELEKPLDIAVTQTLAGLDIDLRGCGALDFAHEQKLIDAAAALDLARVSNHGAIVIERRLPLLTMGRAQLLPPPGAFLQATEEGERLLTQLALAGISDARRVADLFSGVGTFALRLAEVAEVHAVEGDAAMSAACLKAAGHAPGLRRVTSETRDLFRRPLALEELAAYQAVVLDPPRAGALLQAQVLAKSVVPRIVSVSCNVQTFARDAAILMAGGYRLENVTPIDQFRHSAHLELVGVFARPAAVKRRKGILSQNRRA